MLDICWDVVVFSFLILVVRVIHHFAVVGLRKRRKQERLKGAL